MDALPFSHLQQQTGRLETQLRILQVITFLVLVAGAALAWETVRASAAPHDQETKVLRARALILEDDQGRGRILLGAPVPEIPGRQKHDTRTALIFLDENGTDRVTVGFDPKATTRISPQAGINIYDKEGKERGGLGILDNGRVVLGLDYPNGREGVAAFVMPQEGFAGLLLGGEEGNTWERAGLVVSNKDGVALFKIADTNNVERLMLVVQGTSAPSFQIRNERGELVRELLTKNSPK